MSPDEALVARLRDLALVDLEVLLVGTERVHRAELLAAYAEDLEDALGAARERAQALSQAVAGGDPLAFLSAGSSARARDGGERLAETAAAGLTGRAQAGRELARLYELVAHLASRLIEADRLRASLGSPHH